ncbi:hypothetical protein PIB30_116614 [Stylosanthes scabra]|uniref:Secreted protein n=1 Tax=Stylosanthes scabra TaxID=79078 RepID=A0ABU6X0I1_9FABA|nr:hypothetical protein [Stylosanthes scabra]
MPESTLKVWSRLLTLRVFFVFVFSSRESTLTSLESTLSISNSTVFSAITENRLCIAKSQLSAWISCEQGCQNRLWVS